jgi:hypothetical protein
MTNLRITVLTQTRFHAVKLIRDKTKWSLEKSVKYVSDYMKKNNLEWEKNMYNYDSGDY